jgi:hypothetical protein
LTSSEERGFEAAAEEHQIDVVELLSMRRSFSRLFREGAYPPLRGTFLGLEESMGLL